MNLLILRLLHGDLNSARGLNGNNYLNESVVNICLLHDYIDSPKVLRW